MRRRFSRRPKRSFGKRRSFSRRRAPSRRRLRPLRIGYRM